jgi:hypothetical protein
MNEFYIGFTGNTDPEDPEVLIGEIGMADDREFFPSTTEFWSAEDYRRSWERSLRHLLAGAEVSCLVTEMIDPEIALREQIRPLYRDGEVVHIQEIMLFLDELDHPFDPDKPWESVRPRETISEDGDPLMEWTVPLAAVQEFVDTQYAEGA